jgi:hypothetical protein
MHIVFLQPFALSSPGGGSRVLRSLLKDAPVPWTSICTSPQIPPPPEFGEEIHLRTRPSFGRLERTRFAWIPEKFAPLFARRFERRLEAACRQVGATALHSIPHGLDFVHGYNVARRLGLKFFFTVHDDLLISVGKHAAGKPAMEALPEIWRDADECFVICEQMGREYCGRYGARNYQVVTDGIERLSPPRPRLPGKLRVFFMGLFHIKYEANLKSLLQALEIVRSENPEFEISATFHCGMIRQSVIAGFNGIRVTPFGSEGSWEVEIQSAELAYLPLPFEEEHACFSRFSFSTKMVSYLGSGVPILYHGPREAAAYEDLSASEAAFFSHSLDPESVAAVLRQVIAGPAAATDRVERGIELAKRRFMIKEQRNRFWGAIEAHSDNAKGAISSRLGGQGR